MVRECAAFVRSFTSIFICNRLAKGPGAFRRLRSFGDFDLIFGAAKLNLRILEIPVCYRERTCSAPNISRFADGWLLLRMSALAAGRLFFAA